MNGGNGKVLYYSVGTLMLVGIMAWLAIVFVPGQTVRGNPQDMTILEAAYPWRVDLHEAVSTADIIAAGVVKEAKDATWNTPDGRRPNLALPEIVRTPFLRIVTPYVVSISGVMKGDMAKSEVTFVQIGGRVGEDQVVVADSERQLAVGESVVLFLVARDPADVSPQAPNPWFILSKYVLNDRGQACGSGQCMAVSDLYQAIGAH